jgi:monoamine oxidase
MTEDHKAVVAGSGLTRRSFTTAAGTAAAATTLASGTPAAAMPVQAVPAAPAPTRGADFDRCLTVARALLVVDDQDRPLVPRYERVLKDGLPAQRTATPKKVLVVGAGPAGLVTALLLKRAGHHVTVLEANGNRAGGRIKTFRRGGHERAAQPFADPLQYAEAGAMRLPASHPLVMGLIDQLNLKKRRFHYVDVDGDGRPANRTWIHVNGVRMRRADYARAPRRINRSFGVPRARWDTPAAAILRSVLDPVRDEFSTVDAGGKRVDKPLPERVQGWARVIQRFGDWSMFRFLTEHAGLDERTVDLIGTLENLTSRLPLSFIHSFIGSSLISPDTAFWELEGGTAVLPDALLAQVRDTVRFDRRVTRVEYHDPDRPSSDTRHVGRKGPQVWVDTVSEGRDGPVVREQFTADAAVVTVPFSGLRHVQISPLMSYRKRRAVTELHYDSATKVLLEFSRRWWEFTEADWKRELGRIDPKLYDAYRTGRAAADGSLLGAHSSVPASHITPGPAHPLRRQPCRLPRPARGRTRRGRRLGVGQRQPVHVPPLPPGARQLRRSGPGLLQLGGRRTPLGLPGRRGPLPARPVRTAAGLRPARRGLLHRRRTHPELAARPLRLRRGVRTAARPAHRVAALHPRARGPDALRG